MTVNTSNAYEQNIRGGVRVVTVYDDLSGCPPTRSNPLLSATITTAGTCFVRFMGTFIRYASGRTDLYPYYNSTRLVYRLNWTAFTAWEQVVWDAGLSVGAGTHTFSVHAASPSAWGCGRHHGHLSVVVFGE